MSSSELTKSYFSERLKPQPPSRKLVNNIQKTHYHIGSFSYTMVISIINTSYCSFHIPMIYPYIIKTHEVYPAYIIRRLPGRRRGRRPGDAATDRWNSVAHLPELIRQVWNMRYMYICIYAMIHMCKYHIIYHVCVYIYIHIDVIVHQNGIKPTFQRP